MKDIKIIYLLMALALPVCIFLFLKYFGENQFDVEPLFTEAVPIVDAAECDHQYEIPYAIPLSILQDLSWSADDSITVYYFSVGSVKPTILDRIPEVYLSSEVHIVEVVPIVTASDSIGYSRERIHIRDEDLSSLRKCFLFVEEPNNLLLVDNHRRIRGYYQAENRDEIDRLLLELKIILKRY